MSQSRPSVVPLLLTLAGVLPFLAGAIGMFVWRDSEPARYAWAALGLVFYSGVILSFLGGIRWGNALDGRNGSGARIALSVLPSLAGFGLIFYAAFGVLSPVVYWVFAALFAAQFVWDWFSLRGGVLPDWFGTERSLATAFAVGSLAFAAVIAR